MSISSELKDTLFVNKKIYQGLDLGTYSSVWAYKRENGAPKTVDYSGNNRRGVPSLFWYSKNGNEYAGDEVSAHNGQVEDPLGVCSSVKMKLKEQEIKLHNKSYKPKEVLEKIIRRIVEISKYDLQKELVDISFDGLVVGVPAAFSAGEKSIVLSALEAVTKSKTVRLVPEPILAAVSSCYYGSDSNRNKLIFDLGAGTFDVCVLTPNKDINSKNPYPFLVKKSDGLRIAGDVFDERLSELIISKLKDNPYTLNLSNLKNINHADGRFLRVAAREIKEKLSSQEVTRETIMDSNLGMGAVTVKRSEFESVIRADIKKAVDLAYNTLISCGLGSNPDVDIILVGGSSNIPLVSEMIKAKFNRIKAENIRQYVPEKAIALGAAIFAETPDIIDNTPVPFSYAVKTHSACLNKSILQVIVPKGAKLPYTYNNFYCPRYDNQESISFEIYEIYSSENKEIFDVDEGVATEYRFTHRFGKKVSKSTSVRVTTTLTEDGVLESTTDDRGISVFGVQKNRIGLSLQKSA